MQKTLKVYPNPWGVHPLNVRQSCAAHGLDRLGRPGHVVMTEVQPGEKPLHQFVGAKLCPKRTVVHDNLSADERRLRKAAEKLTGDSLTLNQPPQDNCWVFLGVASSDPDFTAKFTKADPVEVPATQYYMQCLKDGDLLPGDGAAADVAGYRCRPANFAALAEAAKRFATPPSNVVDLIDPFEDVKPELPKKASGSTTTTGSKGNG